MGNPHNFLHLLSRNPNPDIPRNSQLPPAAAQTAQTHPNRRRTRLHRHNPLPPSGDTRPRMFQIGSDLALPPGFLPISNPSAQTSRSQKHSTRPTTCRIQRSRRNIDDRMPQHPNDPPPSLMHVLEQIPHDDRTRLRTLLIHALHRNDRLEISVLFPNISIIYGFPHPSPTRGTTNGTCLLWTIGFSSCRSFVICRCLEGLGFGRCWGSRCRPNGRSWWWIQYPQAMASITRGCLKLRQMDLVPVDEERGSKCAWLFLGVVR